MDPSSNRKVILQSGRIHSSRDMEPESRQNNRSLAFVPAFQRTWMAEKVKRKFPPPTAKRLHSRSPAEKRAELISMQRVKRRRRRSTFNSELTLRSHRGKFHFWLLPPTKHTARSFSFLSFFFQVKPLRAFMLVEAQRNMLKHHYAVPSREASRRRIYFPLLDTSVITNDWSRLEAIITYESHSVWRRNKKKYCPANVWLPKEPLLFEEA